MKRYISITSALTNKNLFGPLYAAPSWSLWRTILKAAYAEPLTDEEVAAFTQVANRSPPTKRVKELVIIAGRGAGKDSNAGTIAVHQGINFNPKGRLRPGEKAVIMCLACDREQAQIVHGYIRGMFKSVPALRKMMLSVNADSIELTNNVVIEVHTNSYRSVRGRSIICAIFDECAFWRDENSASPDTETYAAVSPGLGRMPGSMAILISTPHKKSGLLYDRYKKHYGRDDDNVLCVLGTTLQFNPTFDPQVIADALESDPQLYNAEYNSIWRTDIETFIDRQVVEDSVGDGIELPPVRGISYIATGDQSTGSGADSFAVAIAYHDFAASKTILVATREYRPPFSPEQVIGEISDFLKTYGISKIWIDRHAYNYVREHFAKHGITCPLFTDKDEKYLDKSAIYGAFLPLINSKRVELRNNPRLIAQCCALERRVTRGSSNENIDHPTGQHDDLINAAAAALVMAAGSMSKAAEWAAVGRTLAHNPLLIGDTGHSAILYAEQHNRSFNNRF